MGKKTGKKEQILLRLGDDPQLKKEFDVIRHDYGLQNANGIDVLRVLINQKYKEIMKKKGC
jgi:hypothetical protein